MKPVKQLEKSGCGIASVAAIAGFPYAKVKAIANGMGIFTTDPKLWSETSYVRRLLKRFEIKTGARELRFRSWDELPHLALLSIKWHLETGIPCWHWVVFIRENGKSYVLDSKRKLKNNRRMDFGRMKPKWYIPILKKF